MTGKPTEYTFSVKARNKKSESAAAVTPKPFVFDMAANIDKIEDLQILDKTNHSVTLSWRGIPGADAYHVTPRGPNSYPFLDTQTTQSTTYTVEGLAPGARYTFEVAAVKKNYVGKVDSVSGTTKDQSLPVITITETNLMKSHGTTVKLSWDPPKNKKMKWQYGVYYALNMQDVYKGLFIFSFCLFL